MKIERFVLPAVGAAVLFVACSVHSTSDRPGSALGDAGDVIDDLRDAIADVTGLGVGEKDAHAHGDGAEPNAVTGSRLRPLYVKFADGTQILVPNALFDSARGDNCAIATAADGKQRCLPQGPTAEGLYADSECTQPVFVEYGRDCPRPLPKYVSVTRPFDTCGTGGAQVHAVAGEVPFPGRFFRKNGPNCYEDRIPGAGYYRTLSLSPEIPATEFVEMAGIGPR